MNPADRSLALLDNAAILAPIAFDNANDTSGGYLLRLRHGIATFDRILYMITRQQTLQH